MDCSLQGTSINEIVQAIVLEWVAISYTRGYSLLRDRTWDSSIASRRFYHLSSQGSSCLKHRILYNLLFYLLISARNTVERYVAHIYVKDQNVNLDI